MALLGTPMEGLFDLGGAIGMAQRRAVPQPQPLRLDSRAVPVEEVIPRPSSLSACPCCSEKRLSSLISALPHTL